MAIKKRKRGKKAGVRVVGDAKLVAEAMKDIKAGYTESGPKGYAMAPTTSGGMKAGTKKGYGATSYGKAKEAAKSKTPPKKSPPKKQPPQKGGQKKKP